VQAHFVFSFVVAGSVARAVTNDALRTVRSK